MKKMTDKNHGGKIKTAFGQKRAQKRRIKGVQNCLHAGGRGLKGGQKK